MGGCVAIWPHSGDDDQGFIPHDIGDDGPVDDRSEWTSTATQRAVRSDDDGDGAIDLEMAWSWACP